MKKLLTLLFIGLLCQSIVAQEKDLTPGQMKKFMNKEAHRTNPDYVCFIPGSYDYSTGDSNNEHFLVFEGPDGSLMAVWTQAVFHGANGHKNRIVFARSDDDGKSWSKPLHLVGPRNADDPANIASWAFPLVSESGRVYVLWNQNQDKAGWIYFHTGTMAGMYSNDFGKTWSDPQDIPMPASPYGDPLGETPDEWIVWQLPERTADGKYFVGYSRWIHESKAFYNKKEKPAGWVFIESVVEFMKFENIDEDPEPKNISINYSAWGDQALRVPNFLEPRLSVAQEPSIVRLPDDRLFCVLRTASGYIWYSVSKDDGKTWCNPMPLLRKDHGEPILQPVSCCPIYMMDDGRYVLLHHNSTGDIENPARLHAPRNPAYIALGEYRPDADQPIWFSESKIFLDNGNKGPDGAFNWNSNMAVYTSFTTRNGKNILWYPDAKCWLLGKEVSDEFLEGLKVPQ
jgi:hypothetical protein